MNSTLEKTLQRAHGRYFTDLELGKLESYAKSYTIRAQAYSMLCDRADELIAKTLQRLEATDQQVVQEHGDKCKRDMSYVLRAVGVAVLRDDADGFREHLLLWMHNIMAALNKEQQSSRAYRLLQEVIRESMSVTGADLINRLLQEFIDALESGVK
ncbi:MAG TPA: hypothetical protein V6C88_10630 [Chroococcidiopsis sp.]